MKNFNSNLYKQTNLIQFFQRLAHTIPLLSTFFLINSENQKLVVFQI
jgi:hypothetical protein